jgi:hypothetical protein
VALMKEHQMANHQTQRRKGRKGCRVQSLLPIRLDSAIDLLGASTFHQPLRSLR